MLVQDIDISVSGFRDVIYSYWPDDVRGEGSTAAVLFLVKNPLKIKFLLLFSYLFVSVNE